MATVTGLTYDPDVYTGKFSKRADQYYGEALWYAWGMADAGVPGLTLDDGFAFACVVRDAAEAYDRETVGSLGSILSMWADYCRLIGVTIRRV